MTLAPFLEDVDERWPDAEAAAAVGAPIEEVRTDGAGQLKSAADAESVPDYVREVVPNLEAKSPRMALLDYEERCLSVEFETRTCPACGAEAEHRVETDHCRDRGEVECAACGDVREVAFDGGGEQYGWRFRERETDTDVVVVGSGRSSFWDEYGEKVTVVSWDRERPATDGGALELSVDETVARNYPDDGALAEDVVALLEEHADRGTEPIALAGELESIAGALQEALDVPDEIVLEARFPEVLEELQELRADDPVDEEVPR